MEFSGAVDIPASREKVFAWVTDPNKVSQCGPGVESVEVVDQTHFKASAKVGVGGNREYNPGWHAALDLHNLLTISEAITRSAIERKESRGGHFREDFPEKDAAFGTFNIVVRKGRDGAMEVTRAPIPEMPADLKQVIEVMK